MFLHDVILDLKNEPPRLLDRFRYNAGLDDAAGVLEGAINDPEGFASLIGDPLGPEVA